MIDSKKKNQDAKEIMIALVSNPGLQLTGSPNASDLERLATIIAKLAHQLAYKLQDES